MTSPAPRDLHEPIPGQLDLVEVLAAENAPAQAQHSQPSTAADAAPPK